MVEGSTTGSIISSGSSFSMLQLVAVRSTMPHSSGQIFVENCFMMFYILLFSYLLDRPTESEGDCEGQWVFTAVGFDGTARRDIPLQGRLYEEGCVLAEVQLCAQS